MYRKKGDHCISGDCDRTTLTIGFPSSMAKGHGLKSWSIGCRRVWGLGLGARVVRGCNVQELRIQGFGFGLGGRRCRSCVEPELQAYGKLVLLRFWARELDNLACGWEDVWLTTVRCEC